MLDADFHTVEAPYAAIECQCVATSQILYSLVESDMYDNNVRKDLSNQ
jgi:hypothetical protein